MKHLILLGFFLVTWNQYEVIWTNDPGALSIYILPDARTYSVELTTHTQRLETQKDVDLFVGKEKDCQNPIDLVMPIPKCFEKGIIPDGAFNIKVTEEK